MADHTRIDPHKLAQDATFRPAAEPAGSVACKHCGSDQIIPVPVWDLSQDEREGLEGEPGVMRVPVALCCLGCGRTPVHWVKCPPPGQER